MLVEVRDGIGTHVMCSHLSLFPDLSEHGVSKAANPRRGLSLGPSLVHIKLLIPHFFWTQSQWGWVKAVGRPQTLLMPESAGSGIFGRRGVNKGSCWGKGAGFW